MPYITDEKKQIQYLVAHHDLGLAYLRWREVTGRAYNANSKRAFYLEFLGIDSTAYMPLFLRDSYGVPEKVSHRIGWMVGPHYKAMYKIWEAQNDQRQSTNERVPTG